MKPFKSFFLTVFITAAALATTAFIRNKTGSPGKGFAVIELFTSEGCSSCPPADALVAKIEKESGGKPVYILAYHVDYWNHLGWKDQFSSADFSKRQRDYANYLHLQSVYTPQIIVNGKTEFVGSEENTLRNTIGSALQNTPQSHLELNVIKSGKGQLSLKYTTKGAGENAVLMIAVLQKNAQTKVVRGENAGRVLSHVQIVRKLLRLPLNGNSGIENIPLPQGFDSRSWEIIGFLQNASNGAITDASKATFANEPTAGITGTKTNLND